MAKILPDYQRLDVSFLVNYSHLKITGDPCSLIGSHRCDLFPSQLSGFTKNTTTNQISRFVRRNQSIAGKFKINYATFHKTAL